MIARRATRLATSVALALLALLATAHDAAAEPTSEERIAARALFDDGRALMRSHEYALACPKLEESQRLDPGIGTLYNLADCFEGVGRVASAWTTFLDVAEASLRAGEAERAAVAKARAEALASRLPRVRVSATSRSADMKLTLDQRPFATALIDTAVPVDPGDHVLGADAPGKQRWELHFQASLSANVSVTVPALADAPAASQGPIAMAEPAPSPAAAAPRASSPWQTPAAIITASLGVVGLGVGAITGAIAASDWSSAKPDCPDNRCTTAAAYSSWSAAHTAGVVSTASFVAGGVLVAGGAVLWFTRPKSTTSVGVRSDGVVVVGGRFP